MTESSNQQISESTLFFKSNKNLPHYHPHKQRKVELDILTKSQMVLFTWFHPPAPREQKPVFQPTKKPTLPE